MYHNIEKRTLSTGRYPASHFPYRGFAASRIGLDATFLIARRSYGWGAWGVNALGEECKGSFIHARTLRELSKMLEAM